LLTQLELRGIRSKLLTVGSTAGLNAAKRGECDLAGVHLLDSTTGIFNRSFLNDAVTLVEGYGRAQGIVFRRGDERFAGKTPTEIVSLALQDSSIVMVNRNQGSGTRILIDRLLAGEKPGGYPVQPSNHSAVVAAILQHRADWGLAIEAAARSSELEFVPYQNEQYDFVVPQARLTRPAVQAFVALLQEEATRQHLREMQFSL
jgi:putative molybdopterin biosynthesis protein